ncbi:HTH-type transcriptional regulator DmlR [Vibrio mangrovi]|uniref:HTH-type transcriptional regulator DmlR n=2 Tax=Vibrio mangrovi TaxID=474394 RepID=A0A1Y6IW81_9VIBR|nr:LysR family transcriptional regulator [Vibrio mangrovi]MDW6002558.1 LysR family transcriptional regulator [Vibrio mangrovi]SMS01909.1 HTH-type transcriptional regulator DmlR [Vibrio mangrovi]
MEVSQHVRAILSFVEAADAGSFSAAARKLGISAAAVSKNVAGLELVLGVRLMNRTTRKINLTEEGTAFLSQARIALGALESAVDSLVARKVEISGHVKISTSVAFGREYLLPVLPGLLERYPGLTVDVDFDDRMTDLIRDGYDIAIRGGRIVDSSLITRPVCRLKTVLAASPDYLASHGVPQIPEDLTQHRLIARRFLGGRINAWGFKRDDGSLTTMDPEPAVLTLSAPEALVQAAVAGLGIAQIGIHHALQYLESGQLKAVLFGQYDPGSYEMVIQYPHRTLIAPRVKVTVDYLLAAFEQEKSLHFPEEKLAAYQFRQEDS